jgi:hypothetical protein
MTTLKRCSFCQALETGLDGSQEKREKREGKRERKGTKPKRETEPSRLARLVQVKPNLRVSNSFSIVL